MPGKGVTRTRKDTKDPNADLLDPNPDPDLDFDDRCHAARPSKPQQGQGLGCLASEKNDLTLASCTGWLRVAARWQLRALPAAC